MILFRFSPLLSINSQGIKINPLSEAPPNISNLLYNNAVNFPGKLLCGASSN